MTPAPRRISPSRKWIVATIDALEAREMLTASFVPQHIVIPADFDVAKKGFVAEKATSTKAQDVAATPTAKKAAVKVATVPTAKEIIREDKARFQALTDFKISSLETKKAQATTGPPAGTLSPAQVETAYTVSSLGTTNQGQGQTIAIVDEYNDPTIISDANAFSTQFKLPQFNVTGGPTLTVYKDTALGTVTNVPVGSTVSFETSLDVEWAHAMAPKANILLIAVPASSNITTSFAQLLHGVQYGASHASVVSLSYGYPEELTPYAPYGSSFDLTGVYNLNQTYLATGAATNAAVMVSAGDDSLPLFPGLSPNVIGVGGTALHLTASGQYSYETAWGTIAGDGAGGGGTSAFFSTPTFQSSNGINYAGKRAIPDVSMLADPATGVAIYDSDEDSLNGGNPWLAIGGTSLAAPLFAGVISLADQQRATAGLNPLTSVQINNADYGLYNSTSYSTYFHDVTLGQNTDVGYGAGLLGYATTTGYDRATGIGSPIAGNLVPYLASLGNAS